MWFKAKNKKEEKIDSGKQEKNINMDIGEIYLINVTKIQIKKIKLNKKMKIHYKSKLRIWKMKTIKKINIK